MSEVIEQYKKVIIQIATPYSTGTGFYLKQYNVVVTNHHVVNGNREVIIEGVGIRKQLAKVIYADSKYDIAFLLPPADLALPGVSLSSNGKISVGDRIYAIGHPFGLKFTATQGIVSNTLHKENEVRYIQHDAALNPGNSGGPLVDEKGEIIGVNTFIIQQGDNIGFSLPVEYLKEALIEFSREGGQVAVRCNSCSNIVFENKLESSYCPFCGTKLIMPSQEEEYEAAGIARTIEGIIQKAGHDVRLSRRGPNSWEIYQGTARISITYYEPNGLIAGDAVLCYLPKDKIKDIYEFLLREGYRLEGLTFSVRGNEIVLSLIIPKSVSKK